MTRLQQLVATAFRALALRTPTMVSLVIVLSVASYSVPTSFTRAAEPGEVLSEDDLQKLQTAVQHGVDYLKRRGQADDGSYSSFAGSGVTSLATTALLRSGCAPQDPAVVKSLRYLKGCIQPDGGIHVPDTYYRNYETCVAILCLTEVNKDGRYDETIERAEARVKGLQWAGDEDRDESNPFYGGAGYGKHKRPDLSNTSYLVDALHACGNGSEDESLKRALIFVSRCQNLESPHNTTPFAAKVNDGGFYYTCAAGGQSQAGETANGGLRSYASMTYAGLKSMIYAGVDSDDPRVKAAVDWIRKHYGLDSNPGMGAAGLYYYC